MEQTDATDRKVENFYMFKRVQKSWFHTTYTI